MKKFCLLCALLLLVPVAGRAQLWLNPGDSYTYEFTNFTLADPSQTGAGAHLYLGMSGADGTEGFLLEIFENNTSEAPLASFPDIRFVPNPIILSDAWRDRQGVVRFTLTSGSVSIDILFASLVYPNGDTYLEIFDILDTDDDGVADHRDQCPNSAPLVIVDEQGCSTSQPGPTIVAETGRAGYAWAARTDEFTAVSWTQTNAYLDVSISARLYSVAEGDRGTAYLTTRTGPGTTSADQVAVASFSFPINPSPIVLFSNLTLGPGTYYLIVAGATNYWSDWFGSSGANVTLDEGVTHNGNFYFNAAATYLPASIPRTHSNLFQIFAVRGTRMPPNRPPVANAGMDQRLECSGIATSGLLDGRESNDPDGDALTFTWWEGATQLGVGPTLNVDFTSGSHNIRLVVTDPSGSSAEDTVLVAIRDTTAPRIEGFASPAALWPPNGKMVAVTIQANVLDTCDTLASAQIVAVESDDPSAKSNDWIITGPLTLKLRARRPGTGSGRTYRVLVEASDFSGNTSRTTVSILVPH